MFFKHTKWALLWALLIFILCAIPGSDLPHVSVLELISFDKFVHVTMFFILTVLLIKGFKQQLSYTTLAQRAKRIAPLLAITYGGLLEIMQGTCFKERTADIFDFIANSAGAVLAVLLFDAVNRSSLFNKFFK